MSTLPVPIFLLVAAVAAGTVAQGGFYLSGRILVTVLAGLALAAALGPGGGRCRWDRHDTWPVALACIGFGVWAFARAILTGSPAAGLPALATIACAAAAVVVLRRADGAQRELCALALAGIGVLVAISGWAGVVWRIQPLALAADGRLWRASSTLTYANAAAALLAPLAVLAIALLIDRPRSPSRQVVAFVLLAGLGATFSRGGMLALLVGLVLLAVLAGGRVTVRCSAAPLLGALAAVAALAPSVPVSARPQPALAVAGLAGGLLITLAVSRLPGRRQLSIVLAGLAIAIGGFALLLSSGQGMGIFVESRVGLSSPTRTDSAKAALRLVADHPITGVGPGQVALPWMTDGRPVTGRYAHNEYLQVLAELGAIGFVLLLLVLAALVHTIRRGRLTPRPGLLWSGAAAGFAALLVHSGFDFLWQLPVIPLTGALLAGLAGPAQVTTLEVK